MKKQVLLLAFFALLLAASAAAHQPRIVLSSSEQKPVIVHEPEISKVYYSELKGQPHFYKISSNSSFAIYLNVLVAYGSNYTVSAQLLDSNKKVLAALDGAAYNWTVFYEKFAMEYYLQGPELGKDFKSTQRLDAGTYYVKVYNEDNKGKYVLAVGDLEAFPPLEVVKAVVITPFLKYSFFGKKIYVVFCAIYMAIVLFVLYLIAMLFTKKRK